MKCLLCDTEMFVDEVGTVEVNDNFQWDGQWHEACFTRVRHDPELLYKLIEIVNKRRQYGRVF